jgi:hypothetical protein
VVEIRITDFSAPGVAAGTLAELDDGPGLEDAGACAAIAVFVTTLLVGTTAPQELARAEPGAVVCAGIRAALAWAITGFAHWIAVTVVLAALHPGTVGDARSLTTIAVSRANLPLGAAETAAEETSILSVGGLLAPARAAITR